MIKKLLPLFLITGIITALYIGHPSGKVAGTQSTDSLPIRGLVIPHHDFAKTIISSSLDRLSDQSYSTIVIMSPNHFRPQSYSFTTARSVADLPIYQPAIDKVISEFPETVIDSQLVSQEHGFTLQANYLRERFPNAQFVPLLFSPYFSNTDLKSLAILISSILSPDTLYVAAIDFSHNNIWPIAQKYNSQSIEAISSFDTTTILNYTDDHLDSPSAMVTFLHIMQNLQTTNWETWYNSHGAVLSNNPSLNGTSYVIGVFR